MSSEMKTENQPVFKALPRWDAFFLGHGMTFWCPYCQTWHLHDLYDEPKEYTQVHHKNARCNSESPLSASDYGVEMATETELRSIMKAIKEYLDWTEKTKKGYR